MSGVQQGLGLAGQACGGMQEFYPRSEAVGGPPLGLLIGKTGQAAQMAPIGAGAVAAIQLSQTPSHSGSEGGWQSARADPNPDLPMAGAGLHHYAGFMSVTPHQTQDLRGSVI